MSYTIMHISDLHRAQSDPIGNPELLSTLVADRQRASVENPAIGAPNAIVVTGDLVQGVALGDTDHRATLDQQYEVAQEFLTMLCDEFLGGERARLIILPGNHDIDWNRSRAAMAPVPNDEIPAGFSPTMCGPTDVLRWSWDERAAYRIIDRDIYETRLQRFRALAGSFYAGTNVISDPLYRMYPLLDERIVIVAFDSCLGNDCYARHGAIAEDAVARAHLALQHTPYELRVAAWHHSIAGEPSDTDYMSVSVVDRLIGKGFRLGLHGHQHRAAAANRYVHLPEREMMAVVSAGSLCAGARGLPPGVNRQYNLIEIPETLDSARVHVREMAIATNFAPAIRAELGFKSHVDLKWQLPPDSTARRGVYERQLTLRAEAANAEHRFEDAERVLLLVSRPPGSYARRLMVIALKEQQTWERLADELGEPHSIEELVAGTNALSLSGADERAEQYLEAHTDTVGLDATTARELGAVIAARRGMT